MLPAYDQWRASKAHPGVRFGALFGGYLVLFLSAVIVGHVFLPDGFLRGRTTGGALSLADEPGRVALQILSYNLISVAVVIVASLFARRKTSDEPYVSVGQQPLWVLAVLNGIVLGTNSFGIERPDMPLGEKILSLLDVTSFAALWEIGGLVLISAVLADKALIRTTGRQTVQRRWAEVPFPARDWLLLALALVMMLAGAWIEARAVVSG